MWHSKFGSTTYIRRKQLEYSGGKEGIELAKSWIIRKIDNQIALLEKLKRTREKKRGEIESRTARMVENRNKLESLDGDDINEIRTDVFVLEAICGRLYFEAVNHILPDQYKFSGRSRQPAKDPFNAFLNYGYGILYSRVERACILAGLDPYIGFLHTDNYGKKSFVFDIIELFRGHVDEVVIKLFSKRMVKKDMVREIKNGVTLVKEGKQVLIAEFNKAMETKMKYRGRNIKKSNIMEFECHGLANSLIGRDGDVDLGDI